MADDLIMIHNLLQAVIFNVSKSAIFYIVLNIITFELAPSVIFQYG